MYRSELYFLPVILANFTFVPKDFVIPVGAALDLVVDGVFYHRDKITRDRAKFISAQDI